MQGEDGLDEGGDPGCGAPELTQEPLALEGCHSLLDEGADLGVRAVHRLLSWGKRLPASPVRDADRAAGAPVALVGPAGDVGLSEGVDDAVFVGRADVVDGSGQGWRDPQQPAERIGEDLRVHAVFLVFAGVEGLVRGDAVDRQQRPVLEDERLRRRGADIGQGGCEGGQEVDGLGDVAVCGQVPTPNPAASWE